jgi:hypothetical protein
MALRLFMAVWVTVVAAAVASDNDPPRKHSETPCRSQASVVERNQLPLRARQNVCLSR